MKQKLQLMTNGNHLKYKDTDEDLIPAYAKIINRKEISHDPDEVSKLLIGANYTQEDIDTFEKLYNIILNDENFKYMTDSTEILKQAAKSLEENSKLVFPIELEKFK